MEDETGFVFGTSVAGTHGAGVTPERPFPADWHSVMVRACQKVWRQWQWALPAAARADLEQEADCAVVCALPHLHRLPASEQLRYVTAVIRHALDRFVRRELKETFHTCSLQDLPEEQRAALLDGASAEGDRTAEVVPIPHPDLHTALRALSPDQRRVLHLRYWEQRSFDDIAHRLRISVDAAKMRHQRALDKMRKLMRKSRGGGKMARRAAVCARKINFHSDKNRWDGTAYRSPIRWRLLARSSLIRTYRAGRRYLVIPSFFIAN
jgi:RNA polymerase sigma factor (sigma-70 family)